MDQEARRYLLAMKIPSKPSVNYVTVVALSTFASATVYKARDPFEIAYCIVLILLTAQLCE